MSNVGRVLKITILTNILLYLENDIRYGHSYSTVELKRELVCDLPNCAIFHDFE